MKLVDPRLLLLLLFRFRHVSDFPMGERGERRGHSLPVAGVVGFGEFSGLQQQSGSPISRHSESPGAGGRANNPLQNIDPVALADVLLR